VSKMRVLVFFRNEFSAVLKSCDSIKSDLVADLDCSNRSSNELPWSSSKLLQIGILDVVEIERIRGIILVVILSNVRERSAVAMTD
jgi:hypothetical protein